MWFGQKDLLTSAHAKLFQKKEDFPSKIVFGLLPSDNWNSFFFPVQKKTQLVMIQSVATRDYF